MEVQQYARRPRSGLVDHAHLDGGNEPPPPALWLRLAVGLRADGLFMSKSDEYRANAVDCMRLSTVVGDSRHQDVVCPNGGRLAAPGRSCRAWPSYRAGPRLGRGSSRRPICRRRDCRPPTARSWPFSNHRTCCTSFADLNSAIPTPAEFAMMIEQGADPPGMKQQRRAASTPCRLGRAAQGNSASISRCEAWPPSPSSFGPLTSSALSLLRSAMASAACPGRRRSRPDLHHAGDAILDEFQRRQHLGDALAAEILEVAGFEDADDVIADVARERLLLVVLERRGQGVGSFVDGSPRHRESVGSPFRAVHHGVELAACASCRRR